MSKDKGKMIYCDKPSILKSSDKFNADTELYETHAMPKSRLCKRAKSVGLRSTEGLVSVDGKTCDEIDVFSSAFDDIGAAATTWEGLVNDLRISRQTKRKKVEHLTNEGISNIVKKMDSFLQLQASERKTLQDSFHEQASTILSQLQVDLQCVNEEKVKLQKLIARQQKLVQQSICAHSDNFTAFQQLIDTYTKGYQVLEGNYESQMNSSKIEMSNDIANLIEEVRKQEVTKLRDSLSSLW